MRTTYRVRLALVAVIAALGVVPSVQASHGADDPAWVEQAGNGSGASTPVIPDFQAHTALYSGSRFPACNGNGSCASRPGMPKYLSFGLKTVTVNGTPHSILHMVSLGDDGISAAAAQPAFISDAITGQDVPFTFTDPNGFFDVIHDQTLQGGPFAIYYRATAGGATSTSVTDFRRAVSADGLHWTNETQLSDADTATPVLSAARSSYGPTDVILQTSGVSATCTTAPLAATYPWNCKYVMVYDAVSGNHNLAVAGSTNGTAFRGLAGNILGIGAGGSWDDNAVSMGKVRKTSSGYTMYYLGSRAPMGACLAGESPCWSLGVATSSNGLTWTKLATGTDATVNATRYDGAGSSTPASLWASPVLDDGLSHGKLYISRRGNDGSRDTFLAYTAPTPGQCLIRVSSPQNGFLANKPFPVDVLLNDALGTNLGFDLNTLTMAIDGVPVAGVTTESTLVGVHNNSPLGTRATVSRDSLGTLPGGAHTFTVSATDLDGNVCTVTTNFVVDTTAPVTTVTASPSGPQVALVNGVGTFAGTTTDTGTGISRIRATVTNPAGLVKSFHSSDPSGWHITKTNANSWSWVFIGPTLDAHFALPGEYRVSFLGTDNASNQEGTTPANTVAIFVL